MDYERARQAVEEFQQLLSQSESLYAQYRTSGGPFGGTRLLDIPGWRDSEAKVNRRLPQIESIAKELDERLAAGITATSKYTWPHQPKVEVCDRILGMLESHQDTADIVATEAATREAEDGDDLWLPDCVRIFISHISEEKVLAKEVSDCLLRFGLHGFVAHEDIRVSREWQHEIERALGSAQIFVGLVSSGFSASSWTQQEVGWALGRNLPIVMVRLGEDPTGFPAKVQYESAFGGDAFKAASVVCMQISQLPSFGPPLVERMVTALRDAHSYVEARDAAQVFDQMGHLSPELLDALEAAYLGNNEIYPYHVGAKVLEGVFERNGRVLPIPEETLIRLGRVKPRSQ
jgi:hypothetical protein